MAEVFRAEATGLEGFAKRVAIKRVRPDLVTNAKFVRMFLDEARLCARMSHSNCVSVFDVGVGNGTFFLVMEYVDGANLRTLFDWVVSWYGSFAVPEAVYIAKKVCEGLRYAHELTDDVGAPLGIVHRDVSPPNVLITKYGEVKLADFGLARAATHLERSEEGIIKGKFSYLAPESLELRPVDARADLFAVGAVLWELIAGRKLFDAENPLRIIEMIRAPVVPPLRGAAPLVDDELDAILARALAPSPDDRFQSARELAKDLGRWLAKRELDAGALSLGELVRTYRENRGNMRSGVAIIDDLVREELGRQVTTMHSVPMDTPDWATILAEFRLPRRR